ncbi:hypothetical protein [Pseudolactococcus laudensis]|uniref:hypothetical protein n=1 Tax=Pseudolactococcus laudensis TaxID=1494461 RepID=UPI002FCC4C38
MNQTLKQNKKKHNRYIVLTGLTLIIGIILIAVYETSLGKNIKKEDVSSQSETLTKKAEENLTPAELNLTSTQNGREIKLTKFMATKKKFIFDYQFKLDDERLKELLRAPLITTN